MPSTSARERAAICSVDAATITSQPRMALATVSNWAVTEASSSWRRRSREGWTGGPAIMIRRNFGPVSVTEKPSPSIQSLKSGGTQKRTSCPRSRRCRPRATRGWTSPRVPIVDSSARIEQMVSTRDVALRAGARRDRALDRHSPISGRPAGSGQERPRLCPGITLCSFQGPFRSGRDAGGAYCASTGARASVWDQRSPSGITPALMLASCEGVNGRLASAGCSCHERNRWRM